MITIDKDQKKRLAVFADYCKKSEGFLPINDHNLFVLKDDVLEVYAVGDGSNGGNGCVDIKLDVKSKDSLVFSMDVQKLVSAISKVRNDSVTLKVSPDKVVVENPTKVKNFVSITTFPGPRPDEVEEIRSLITKELSPGGSFDTSIEVKIDETNRKVIDVFSEITKLLDVNDSFEISDSTIKAADNLGIIEMKTAPGQITMVPVIMNRCVTAILKLADEMKVSGDAKFQYVGIGVHGVRVLFQPKLPRWQFPTPKEILDISPDLSEACSFTVKGKELLEAIDQFGGMFSSDKWKYQQVKLTTRDDTHFDLHFDDMATEVNEEVECSDFENTTQDSEIEFILPTIHISRLKDYLVDEKVQFVINNKSVDEAHGVAVTIKTPALTITEAKLLEG
jgi:hypothetical protein